MMLAERLHADELMDDPALDPAIYHAVLTDLAKVNAVTMAYRPTLQFLERAVGQRREFALLDVGFGDGDMLRQIARWAKTRGITAHLTGIDLNPRSEAAAKQHSGGDSAIHYISGDYADLAGEGFDCIISSLVAHHMTEAQIQGFLHFMEREAALGWFINDLHRHGFTYLGYPLLARLMRWHPIVRNDGRTSIARSFRMAEWRRMLVEADISHARIIRKFPFRLCVERIR